jgi:rhodanese-related sulfurtransferase
MIQDGTIVDADISATANIVDTKLNTISTAGKVDNSATTGTETSTPNTLVLRDGNADFDASLIGVRGVQFDTITPEQDDEGRIVWSTPDGGLLVGLEGGNVSLPIGQKNVIYVKNDSGVTIPKASSVMAVGAVGDRIQVALADASGATDAMFMLGVSAESIPDGDEGFITTLGYIRNLNTVAYPVGTILYFDPNTPGGLTDVAPIAPELDLPIAIVTRSHASTGILYVRMKNGEYLDELHDVRAAAPSDKDILEYNSTLGVWENSSTLADHVVETLNVHGIADTSVLATQTDLSTDIGTHNTSTTSVHGISDTADLVYTTDARLSDARTPTAHASTHIPGGADEIDVSKFIAQGSTLPLLPDPLYPSGTLFAVGSAPPYLIYRSSGAVWDQLGASAITVSDTAPSTPQAGDLWYDSAAGKTFIYYDSFWVEMGNNTNASVPLHGVEHEVGGSDAIRILFS